MSLRTNKVDEAFYEIISAFDFDGVSRLTGQATSDFTVSFYKDGAEITAPSHTIVEIGTDTGEYALTVSDGFDSVGYWMVSILIEETEDIHRVDIEVRESDIGDVYSVLSRGFGSESVVITLVDTLHSDAPIEGARVNVWNSSGTTFLTFGNTSSDGQLDVSLDAGDYLFKFFKSGVSIDDETITVATTGSVQNFTIEAESLSVAAPSSPTLCRIYADFVDQGGSAVADFIVSVTNLFDPSSSAGLSVVESHESYVSNSEGHVEFDVVIGAAVKISLVSTGLSRDLTIPDQTTANLFDLLGSATDPFQVVEDSSNPFVVVSVG